MMLKISEKKKQLQNDDAWMKPFFKPLALLFDDRYETIKQCKAAYKKMHKQICIPVSLEQAQWITPDGNESQCIILQLCELYDQPKEDKQVKMSIGEGVSILYVFQSFKVVDKDEVQKLEKKFADLI